MDKKMNAPLRKCVISKERLYKNELFRILRTPEGDVVVDKTMKANGRGAYLKKDKDVIMTAKKSKALDRQLEVEVKSEIYDELLSLLDSENNEN